MPVSDLQLALVGAGAALVAGVWGYNKWLENRHRKLAEQVFRGQQADVLTEGGPAAAADADVRREPVIEPGIEPSAPPVPDLPAEWADETADCVIRLDFVEPVPASALWAAQSLWAGHLDKRLVWLGLDRELGDWRHLSAEDSGRFGTVCASLQVADRRGAVSDNELVVFLDGVRELAGQLAGVAEVPPRDAVLLRARNLDDFCAGVDVQLGVNVVDPEAGVMAGPQIQRIAESNGMALLEDGSYHALDDAGMTLFTLNNIGNERFGSQSMQSLATHGLTLSLDVPRVADGVGAFDRMLDLARQLVGEFGATLVDGQRHALTAEMIDGIRAKVGDIQQQMAERQVAAGGIRALRLFS